MDKTCRNCGGIGHFARNCSSAPNSGASFGQPAKACFTCGQFDHVAVQCPKRELRASPAGLLEGPRFPAVPGTAVYIGNLPWKATWHSLKDYMSSAGEVAHVKIPTTIDGRSKGFAIVRFADEAGAKRAIESLNGSTFFGRAIEVRLDHDSRNQPLGDELNGEHTATSAAAAVLLPRDNGFKGVCNNCKQYGHRADRCTGPLICSNCGQANHKAANCTNEAICRNCKQPGHLAATCQAPPVCHKCHQSGHIASLCASA